MLNPPCDDAKLIPYRYTKEEFICYKTGICYEIDVTNKKSKKSKEFLILKG